MVGCMNRFHLRGFGNGGWVQSKLIRAGRGGALVAVLALGCFIRPRLTRGQSAVEVIEQLNREGMQAYSALDIDRAGSMLEEALRVAQEGAVSGRPLALANLNLGVVYVGGLNDVQSGRAYLLAALCADRSIALEPGISTPELVEAFAAAKVDEEKGACGVASVPVAAPAVAAAPVLAHAPVLVQQSQTPLPVYVELGGAARSARLFFRGLGMDEYRQVAMVHHGDGLAYQVGCNDVWEPRVSYYLEALDSSARVIGRVGSAAEPIVVQISTDPVDAPPAFPNEAAPGSCIAPECPPGVECSKPGVAAMGERCASQMSCQGGLLCVDERCTLMGPDGPPEPAGWDEEAPGTGSAKGGDPRETARFFTTFSMTVGMPFVSSGMPTDRSPPSTAVFVNSTTGQRIRLPEAASEVGNRLLADEQYFPSAVSEWVPDADSNDDTTNGLGIGGPCSADGIVTGPGAGQLYPSSYCARVKGGGFAPHTALRFGVGYFLTTQMSLAAIVRYQLTAGVGSLSHLLLGARGEYLLDRLREHGLVTSIFAGITLGQIQAQPSYENGSDNSPWIRSGPLGVHAGMRLRWRIARNLGFVFSPEADIQVPAFLVNIDLPVGLEAAF